MTDSLILRNGGDYVLRNGGDRILRNPDPVPTPPPAAAGELESYGLSTRKKQKEPTRLEIKKTVQVYGSLSVPYSTIKNTTPIIGKLSHRIKQSFGVYGPTIDHLKQPQKTKIYGVKLESTYGKAKVMGTRSFKFVRDTLKEAQRMLDDGEI